MRTHKIYAAGKGHLLYVYTCKGVTHTIEVYQIVTSTHPDDLVLVARVSPKDNQEAEQLIESAKVERWWE